ncbi:hypothetical protein CYMTET_49308 [Cymbomonas tetramitiformis]|uniref:Uncharacterized protein n=1 Tax=Cymbomonas tetramitiformis TaxID=36881 RepID=A0AAE0BRP5_9CHLO|nr:hypothetical protein CYMTET_49308 [Cymbomonas tetramitiformis]|eukprot:gene12546-14826_t
MYLPDFDKAYVWIGFRQKVTDKRHLLENFERGVNYTTELDNVDMDSTDATHRHRTSEPIMLTADYFYRRICMTANTAQDNRVRKCYLERERRLRDGDVAIAGQVIQNYDVKTTVKTDVSLKTKEVGANGTPAWVGIWRDARTKHMVASKSMVAMLLKAEGATGDLRAYHAGGRECA